ncbi:hypothetical protein EYF80_022367 [Liparis tanakae]|uniref:Uncharacterized protein n=1 Tax=Liparis tanakae TaxID=230148 RepID=A0A4Z2HRJ3_9TELE|nr:hypothetical protein EYF80_022367 [Liparis tanakae]
MRIPVRGPVGQDESSLGLFENLGQSGCAGITILPSDPDDIIRPALPPRSRAAAQAPAVLTIAHRADRGTSSLGWLAEEGAEERRSGGGGGAVSSHCMDQLTLSLRPGLLSPWSSGPRRSHSVSPLTSDPPDATQH